MSDPYTHFIKDKNYAYAGKHVLIDLIGCTNSLSDSDFIKSVSEEAVLLTGANIVSSVFHSFGEGCGVTGLILLSESHYAIHTWPELHLAVLDIFTCGEHTEPSNCLQFLKESFGAGQISVQEIKRALTVI